MYKNFKITEEEKKQILESHMSHGYKKPLKENDSDNQNSEEFIKMKFFDKKIEEFEDEMINLIEDAKDNFYNWKGVSFDSDIESSQKFDKLVGMVVNKIEGFAKELKMEYLENEPNDDQIMNRPGSEGGVSYKSDNDNFQGR